MDQAVLLHRRIMDICKTGDILKLSELVASSEETLETRGTAITYLPSVVKHAIRYGRSDIYPMIDALRGNESISEETVRLLFTLASAYDGQRNEQSGITEKEVSEAYDQAFDSSLTDMERFHDSFSLEMLELAKQGDPPLVERYSLEHIGKVYRRLKEKAEKRRSAPGIQQRKTLKK